jgi:hypothetical protein
MIGGENCVLLGPQKVLNRNGGPGFSSIDVRKKLESYWDMLNDLQG